MILVFYFIICISRVATFGDKLGDKTDLFWNEPFRNNFERKFHDTCVSTQTLDFSNTEWENTDCYDCPKTCEKLFYYIVFVIFYAVVMYITCVCARARLWNTIFFTIEGWKYFSKYWQKKMKISVFFFAKVLKNIQNKKKLDIFDKLTPQNANVDA